MKKYLFSLLLLSSAFFLNGQVNILTQGFEALPFPPTGWSNVRITGPSFPGNWARYGNGIAPVQTPHTGAWQIRFNSANFGAGTSGELRTNVQNFTTAGTYTVSLWVYRDNWVGNDKLEVFVNTTQTSVGGTLLGTINRDRAQSPAEGTNGWYQYTFTIPSTFNTATNYVIFKATSAFGKDIYVDDLSIDRLPAAPPGCVTSFSPAPGVTGLCTNANLTWGIVPLASGYKISLGTNAPNYNNVANNIDLGVALSYSTIFNPSTTYGWKITPYNGFGEAACVVNTFTTGTGVCYITPVYLEGSCGSEDFIDDFSTSGGVTNIVNNNTGCTTNPNNYTYFAAQNVTIAQGAAFNVSMQSGPDFEEGFAIWIDYNIDGDFNDAGEYAFNSATATTAIINGTITVPYTALPGITRMRVRCAYNYVPTAGTSAATLTNGETEDYNVTITACPTTTYYTDADFDTYGNIALPVGFCYVPPAGYTLNSTDCNDANAAINPGATEICNGIDDNCAGGIDNGLTFLNYYTDADGDSFGNSGASPVSSCAAVAGSVTNNTDCNDGNAAIKPGAIEVCNGIDDNCNGSTDEGLTLITYYADADGDTYGNIAISTSTCSGAPFGYVLNNTDCNDGNAAINPGATEICNGIDDDCAGGIDNGLIFTTYYADADVDTYGSAILSTSTCNGAPLGYVTNNLDCNDANANIKPGAIEICNSIDDDCDAAIDEGVVIATITPAGVTTFCSGGSVLLQAPTGGGNTYQWIRNGANVAGAITATYNVNKSGSYQVKVTIPGGCNATSATTTVTVLAAPKATITTPGGTNLCGLASVLLKTSVVAGGTYQWIKNGANIAGATSNTYNATTIGSYRVKVTNASGCSKTSAITTVTTSCKTGEVSDEISMTIHPNPATDLVNLTLLNQNGANNVAISIAVFDLSGKQIDAQIVNLIDGEVVTTFDVTNWTAGLYLVSATGPGIVLTGRIAVTK